MGEDFEKKWREVTSGLDPRTLEMNQAFGAIREMFENLLAADFTEKQALRFLAYGMFQTPEEGPGATDE